MLVSVPIRYNVFYQIMMAFCQILNANYCERVLGPFFIKMDDNIQNSHTLLPPKILPGEQLLRLLMWKTFWLLQVNGVKSWIKYAQIKYHIRSHPKFCTRWNFFLSCLYFSIFKKGLGTDGIKNSEVKVIVNCFSLFIHFVYFPLHLSLFSLYVKTK